MATWTWPVASGQAMEVEAIARVAAFGDGYEQRASAGLRRLRRRFDVRLAADYTAVVKPADDFLRACAGVEAFDWTPPDGAPGKFVCRKWSISYGPGNGAELTATFEETWV
ncbi:MAG: phage tail protein [Rhodocyclaceae bacterium]|nr:phage tail protein [Rhodocyclaceae bacterium]